MSHKDYYINQISQDLLAWKNLRREALLSLGNTDAEKVDFLLNISYDLTPLGFECFVAYFLEAQFWYKMFVQGGYYDEWIDIKGARTNSEWHKEFAVVQCKKWNARDIWVGEVAEFYGRVADIRYEHPNTELYYATTTACTSNAKAFMDEKWIIYLDFDVFLNLSDYISVDGFAEYLNRHALQIVNAKKDKDQTQIYIETNSDAYELLKQVRLKLAREFKVPAYLVAKNNQLCEIIKHHPKSVNEFVGIGGFTAEHAARYWQKFVEAISKF